MKTGRNDLCPCGSGKKFKKCCIDKKDLNVKIVPRETIKPIMPGFGDFKPNPKLWALIHLNGRDPEKCTCNDCADARIDCPRNFNPKHCAETSLMGEPEIF